MTIEEKYKSFYIVIPTLLFEDSNLPERAKKLYGIIVSLCKKDGYCWASNRFLAEVSNIPESTVRKYLQKLKAKNWINCELNDEGNSRKIFLKFPPFKTGGCPSMDRGGCPSIEQSVDRGVSIDRAERGHPYNNINNINNNNILFGIRDFWNSYQSLSSLPPIGQVRNIRARARLLPECRRITPDIEKVFNTLLKNYTEEDFKKAIQNYIKEILARNPASDYASHRFSFYEFFKQSNGFKKFINR